jgi:hypothetical protein
MILTSVELNFCQLPNLDRLRPMTRHLTLLLFGFSMVAGCAKEPQPRSVSEFLDNPILLEAAMVRCSQDRSGTRYDAECVNARQAVDRVQAKEEAAAKAAFEARSESKRNALRRTQAAAAEARRRAAEAQRQREEAEYLAQFGVSPPDETTTAEPAVEGDLPEAGAPVARDEPVSGGAYEDPSLATDGGNAPVSQLEPESPATDLESIRDELRRRDEEGGD